MAVPADSEDWKDDADSMRWPLAKQYFGKGRASTCGALLRDEHDVVQLMDTAEWLWEGKFAVELVARAVIMEHEEYHKCRSADDFPDWMHDLTNAIVAVTLGRKLVRTHSS